MPLSGATFDGSTGGVLRWRFVLAEPARRWDGAPTFIELFSSELAKHHSAWAGAHAVILHQSNSDGP